MPRIRSLTCSEGRSRNLLCMVRIVTSNVVHGLGLFLSGLPLLKTESKNLATNVEIQELVTPACIHKETQIGYLRPVSACKYKSVRKSDTLGSDSFSMFVWHLRRSTFDAAPSTHLNVRVAPSTAPSTPHLRRLPSTPSTDRGQGQELGLIVNMSGPPGPGSG